MLPSLVDVLCEEGRFGKAPECCGTPACVHTVIEHDGHLGYLAEGQLFCQLEDCQDLQPHVLDMALPSARRPAAPTLPAAHVHGPDCGHELVPHNDHFDFLVGDELHHLVQGRCCERACATACAAAGTGTLFHGHVSVVRHRRIGMSLLPKAVSTTHMGSASTQTVSSADAGNTLLELVVLPSSTPKSTAGTAAVELADNSAVTRIFVSGLCCATEVPLIQKILGPLPGVQKVDVVVAAKAVRVVHDPAATSPAVLVAALNEARLDAALISGRTPPASNTSWRPPWHVLLSAALVIVALFGKLSGPTHTPWLHDFEYVALGSVAVGILPIIRRAIGGLRHKTLDINMLMTIAVAGAIALQDYIEAAAVVVLFSGAAWLELRCTAQARASLAAVLSLQPEQAVLASTGEEVPAADVPLGSLILVRPGNKVPLDGLVRAGASHANQSMLTGESAPVAKTEGDLVIGGTLNCGTGALEVETTALAGTSAVARMGALVEQAVSQQSPMETLVARFAKWYTPLTVAACLGLAVIPIVAGAHNRKHWLYLSLQILVTACPCALVLSTPVAVVVGLSRAASQGVLIKGGVLLEALANTKVVTFDKTGTLTQGRFQVVHVEVLSGTDAAMLQVAGCIERTSAHPLAAAITGRAAALGLDLTWPVLDSQNLAGQGVVACLDNKPVAVGNARLLRSQAVVHNATQVTDFEQEWGSKGATVVWVAASGVLLGSCVVADVPRAEAAAAVTALRHEGICCAMLTGDNAGAAASVATAVGIAAENTHAGLLPEDKLQHVRSLRSTTQQRGTVVHVGDGVNDAPALATADVGIAMGVAGAAVALEAADVALFTSDLRCLAPVVQLGRQAQRKIKQNISLAVVTKVAVLVLAPLGYFTLWGAVLVDVGIALLVVLNSMTLSRWRLASTNPVGPGCEAARGMAAGKCCAEVSPAHATSLNSQSASAAPTVEACNASVPTTVSRAHSLLSDVKDCCAAKPCFAKPSRSPCDRQACSTVHDSCPVKRACGGGGCVQARMAAPVDTTRCCPEVLRT